MEKKKRRKRLNATQILVFGFAGIILLGGFLLSLPIANQNGKWLFWIDALFSSCTAVCVTGLMTVVPAAQFTIFGKAVLLLLIQIGALGVIVCTLGVFVLLKKKITVRERLLIREQYDLDTMGGLVRVVRYVIHGTFVAEGIGAALYAFVFVPEYGWIKGICFAVFHAVSAFCNAGIDLLGSTSLAEYAAHPLINFTTMGLIIVSGLGFLVWQDLWKAGKRLVKEKAGLRRSFHKFELHTKLVLVTTAVLLLGGTVIILALEWGNPDTLGSLSPGSRVMAAAFQSVTTRTAGFYTVSQAALRDATKFFCCILMFIGGSPGGTAGGIKTTTVAMLLLTCWSVLKGRRDTECFDRRISSVNVRTGFAVFTVGFLFLLCGTIAVSSLENSPLTDVLYEVTSALATVGLSADLTPGLGDISKCIIIFLMYVGRIGPITLAMFFSAKVGKNTDGRELPERRIFVG